MRRLLVSLFLLSALTACGGNTGTGTEPTPSQSGSAGLAIAYQTSTPSDTPVVIPPRSGVVLPTPTTFKYTIVEGDTLIGIAGRYNVTLEALLAANPAIQPSALSVGATIIIPSGGEVSGESTPTPVPLPVLQARCWPETDGGKWCFALVKNEYGGTLENLSALFTLQDSDGQDHASQVAFALLNTLPAGQSMPLAVHFPPPVQANGSLRVSVLTAIRLLQGDTRYLPVLTQNTLVSLDASGRTAHVTGRGVLTGTGTANTLWVLATAYDAVGDVVGVRRWESPSALTAEAPVSFDFMVSSVGPGIDRVEFLAEARP